MITKIEVFSALTSAPELPLGGTLASDDPVHIREITGLGPVKAEISTTPFATSSGELYQGSSVGKRNIVMTLGFNPDYEGDQSYESLRQLLYAYLMPQAWTKLRFTTDSLPVVEIEGYVESFEPSIFAQDPEVQVSIICPRPDFVDPDAVIINGVVDDGTNEYAIEYIGTSPTGFEMRVQQSPENPSYEGSLDISSELPDGIVQTFSIDPVTIDGLKYFKLSTVKNQKRVQNVAVADSSITNLLANVTSGEWPEMQFGENLIKVIGEETGQIWTLAYFNRFGGL